MSPAIYDGRLHSPYFIFIRDAEALSDSDLLGCFSLDDYLRVSRAPQLPSPPQPN